MPGTERGYDWRDLVGTMSDHEAHANQQRPTEHDVLLREVLRLRALGRTPDDIGTLLGMNPGDVHLLVFGPDEEGSV